MSNASTGNTDKPTVKDNTQSLKDLYKLVDSIEEESRTEQEKTKELMKELDSINTDTTS